MKRGLILNLHQADCSLSVDECNIYGTCHKKLNEIRGLFASVIRSFSAALSRISAESSKGVRGVVKGCPRNRQRVSAESSNGVRGFVEGHQHSHNRQRHPRNRTVFLD